MTTKTPFKLGLNNVEFINGHAQVIPIDFATRPLR